MKATEGLDNVRILMLLVPCKIVSTKALLTKAILLILSKILLFLQTNWTADKNSWYNFTVVLKNTMLSVTSKAR